MHRLVASTTALLAALALSGCGGGGGGGGMSCPASQISCTVGSELKCVDPLTDRAFCGADATCAGYTACGAGQLCVNRVCTTVCPGGEYACGGSCIDPSTDATYCGAAADCSGGHACGAGSFCSAGACWSPCGAGMAFCGSRCIDPSTNRGRCGASGLCSGVAAGTSCAADRICTSGSCDCPAGQTLCGDGSCQFVCAAASRPGWEWKASVPLTSPPHFTGAASSGTVLAHVVFDGTNMVDSTGNTHWTAVGAPGTTWNGMRSPAQPYSGPFSATTYWVGDEPTRQYLRDHTSGPFTICARYKPGAHPGLAGHNKIVFALGKPEAAEARTGDVLGGWALMQMHTSDCFHYSSATSGEFMVPSSWSVDGATLASMEWVWQCGGWDGTSSATSTIAGLRESTYTNSVMAWGGTPPLQPGLAANLEPPAIGAYFDGTAPLWDGGVYEIVVTSDPATASNMTNLVARASHGLRGASDTPVPVIGADGTTHLGSPGTVRVSPDGSVPADQDISLGATLPASPAPSVVGQCWGIDLSAPDWTALGNGYATLLGWSSPLADHQFTVAWNRGSLCMGTTYPSVTCTGGLSLASGSRHTFHFCIAGDRTMRTQVDQQPPVVGTTALPSAADVPDLTNPASTFWLGSVSPDLAVWRVWACAGSDPAACP